MASTLEVVYALTVLRTPQASTARLVLMASSDLKGYHQIIQVHANHAIVIQLVLYMKSVLKMRTMPEEVYSLDLAIANMALKESDVIGVLGVILVTLTVCSAIVVGQEAQIMTLV